MKEMNKTERFTEKEWEELAAIFSGEKVENDQLLSRFAAEDIHKTQEKWKELGNLSSEKNIDIDVAWNKVYSKLNEHGVKMNKGSGRIHLMNSRFMKIAAATLLILGLGSTALYLNNSGYLSKKISIVTGIDEKNIIVNLPDGSKITLNRSSEFSYRENFGKQNRNVKLAGEAFFEITPDANKPFIVDAGKADVKVVGTTFNVITNNTESAVEVYVVTGKVILSDKAGSQFVALESGYIGTIDSNKSGKSLNDNPNYRSWNTGLLVYTGQKLDVVFKDLKRVYNMNIVADDPAILENPWSSPIDNNETQETIINIICNSFNLSYSKDGNVFHLAKK
jgi:transmembrane sensor